VTRDDRLRSELEALERTAPTAAAPTHDLPAAGMRWLRPALLGITALSAILVALLLTGQLPNRFTGASTQSPSAVTAVEAQARNGDLLLTLSSPKSMWATDEAIEVVATLTFVGSGGDLLVFFGAGSSPLVFNLRQLSAGDGVLEGDWDLVCRRFEIPRDAPLAQPFSKSGEIHELGPFDEAFFRDPDLHLPAGRWQVEVFIPDSGGADCGGPPMQTAIEIEVVDREPAPVETEEALPSDGDPASVTGVLEGDPNLESGCIWLRDAVGDRWEILWPDGYSAEFSGDLPAGGTVPVILRNREVIARGGDLVTVSGHRPHGVGSHCMVGIVFAATEVVGVTPQLEGEIDCGVQPENVCDGVVAALAAGIESAGGAIEHLVLVPYECRLDATDPVGCPPVLNTELAVGAMLTLADGTERQYNCLRPIGGYTFECGWIDTPPIIN
jgi:hypothetical protein